MHDATKSPLPLKLSASGATDIGRGRRHNEDSVLLRPDLQLYIVADGAGGHNAGNVASALAATSIANYFEATDARFAELPEIDEFGLHTGARRLATALLRANQEIIEVAKSSNKYKGMGTTVVALSFSASGACYVAHVGDSRCYRWRQGELEQLTHDHSLINDVLELRPDVDDATLRRLPRNVVTRALGMEENLRISVQSNRVVTGDRYLLCSDGLTDALDPTRIAAVLSLDKHPDDMVRVLIEMANESGGRDNIAALVIACEIAPGGGAYSGRRISGAPRPDMTTIVDPIERAPRAPSMAEASLSGLDAEGLERDTTPEIVIVKGDSDEPDVVPSETATPGLREALAAIRLKRRPMN